MHTLSKSEKRTFYTRLVDLKLPNGYGSNMSNRISINECKVKASKSHDYHILMQQLLVITIRGL